MDWSPDSAEAIAAPSVPSPALLASPARPPPRDDSETDLLLDETRLDEDDIEIDEDIELMLEHHDDPTMTVLYVETRRRGGSIEGPADVETLGDGLLLLEDDGDELQPIAPRRDSVDSPTEDWDMELGVDDEIKGAQLEMASGFRSLISRGIDRNITPIAPGEDRSKLGTIYSIGGDSLGNILSDELTTIQSNMPVCNARVTTCVLVEGVLLFCYSGT